MLTIVNWDASDFSWKQLSPEESESIIDIYSALRDDGQEIFEEDGLPKHLAPEVVLKNLNAIPGLAEGITRGKVRIGIDSPASRGYVRLVIDAYERLAS